MKKFLAVLLAGVMMFAFVACGSDSDKETKADTTTTTEAQKESKKETTLGDTFEFDGLEITLGSDIQWTKVDNQFSDQNGKEVFSIPITVKNNSEETHGLNMFYYNVYGINGTRLDDITAYFSSDDVAFAGDIRPEGTQESRMHILYDGDGDYYIEFDNYTDKLEVKVPVAK